MSYEHAIALTGSIATGKSTVCNLLKLHGYRIIDADVIAHEVLVDKAGEVTALFGTADRGALGAIVFNDTGKRQALEAIVHPEIRRRILSRCEELEPLGVPYFVDIPLFFESGAYPFGRSVVVYAPREQQMVRLYKERGYDEHEAIKRIDTQLPILEKKRRATWVIDNSGDIRHLTREVDQFVRKIRELD